MAKQFAVLISLFAVFTSLLPLVSSTPVPNWEVDILRTWGMDVLPEWPTVELPFTGRRTFIGYRGFTGEPKAPYASGGGELGAVYYVADVGTLSFPPPAPYSRRPAGHRPRALLHARA